MKNMAAFKIDLRKAYDRVEWSFLESIMLKLGFNCNWVNLILKYISSAKFSVQINGKKKGNFRSFRRLRQGDPLSPYLFLLVAEGLSHLITKATNEGRLTGLSLSHGPSISHLLFVDDSIILSKAEERELMAVKVLLNKFELALGNQ